MLLQNYKIPDSLREFDRMVSLTAAKTNLILFVSVAWVKLGGASSVRSEELAMWTTYCG